MEWRLSAVVLLFGGYDGEHANRGGSNNGRTTVCVAFVSFD